MKPKIKCINRIEQYNKRLSEHLNPKGSAIFAALLGDCRKLNHIVRGGKLQD